MLRFALKPKSKLTLESGTNPTNRNTTACFSIHYSVMSCMRVCRKQALSRVKYYYYVTNSKIQQTTIMTVIMTK